MRKHRQPTNNSSSRENRPGHAFSSSLRFYGATPVETGLIMALYCIFSRHLVSEQPLRRRPLGRSLDRRPWRQIEGGIRIRSEKIGSSLRKTRISGSPSLKKNTAAKSSRLVDMWITSPLRSELPTDPHSHKSKPRGGKGKKSQTGKCHIDLGYPQAAAYGYTLRYPSGGCVWITPERAI